MIRCLKIRPYSRLEDDDDESGATAGRLLLALLLLLQERQERPYHCQRSNNELSKCRNMGPE